ncbi:hypothetical protein LY28_02747 [Ruminiclostridium sufflavum DSM 19573]|uniref:Uncharacterized protein n=1 Tax=Ruminiclostridium sufflavum DSM 19573 TaxID=1121337 RepID=A0A318Y3X0_9FIRM|nr:hypothetical protein [Ruminiclostridium sufflavum]PYG86721.1 hypothetical protein LY28_02747 [Ruminiclostridium sufflavum DSM 19573]
MKGCGAMTNETLIKAIELTESINELEDFMFWCSGKREVFRFYPASIIKIKRRWWCGVDSKEYELPKRLQEKIAEYIQEELNLLRAERDNL